MHSFELIEPRSFPEALLALDAYPEGKAIAGGTALMIMIKQRVFLPPALVNLKKIANADAISLDPEVGVRLGALATIHMVERHPFVVEHLPILASACHVVANIRIRNLATIGGNVAHADYQSDPPTALIALGAAVEITGPGGNRHVDLEDFIKGTYETSLEANELVTGLTVPVQADVFGNYLKFTTHSSEDRPCVGVATTAAFENEQFARIRVVVGAVSPVPVRITAAETMAVGRVPTSELIDEIADAASRAVDPIDDLHGEAGYKRKVVRALVRRALHPYLARGSGRS